jgi:hypothetical protein
MSWAQSTSQDNRSTSQPTPELSAPQTPPTLEEMPSQPPTVTYQDGKLTIIAKNSTLKDILQTVCEQTGAQMDIPEDAKERVVLRLGPGSPRDVMAALLNGSHFNYVMVGSVQDPSALTTVVLTPKSDEKETRATTATAAVMQLGHAPSMAAITPASDRRALLQRQVLQQQQQLAQSAALAAGEPEPPSAPEEVPQVSAPATAEAAAPPETPAQPPGENHDAAAKDNGPKTPMQTLQDLYSARYQMMQQQNQPRPQQQEPPPQPDQQQSQ